MECNTVGRLQNIQKIHINAMLTKMRYLEACSEQEPSTYAAINMQNVEL